MNILKKILAFFLSLRTAIWVLVALLVFLLLGSFIMPRSAEFQSINDRPLFSWLRESSPGATWWLWGSIALLALLTANTLLCSAESLLRKKQARQWLLIISPQVIHIGFLFILLAHLISSAGSFRGLALAGEGSAFMLPTKSDEIALRVRGISFELGPRGYMTDWGADIEYLSGDRVIKEARLAPNRPSFYAGLGIYLKEVRPYPVKACLLEVSREPGGVWAFAGAMLFVMGTATLVILKIRGEGGL